LGTAPEDTGDFFCGTDAGVGILIGSIVSGRTSAMKSFGFGGTTATPLRCRNLFQRRIPFHRSSIAWNRSREYCDHQVMERRQSKKRRAQPNDQDDPMQDFFDRFFDGRQDGPPQAERSLAPASSWISAATS